MELQRTWEEIQQSFGSVSIPRYIGLCPASEAALHIFVDASAKAYAAVAYIRLKTGMEYKVQLLFSKNRLAPLKQKITIPRLELLAVLIGCRMMQFLKKTMKMDFKQCVLRTDSECCLHWLKTVKPLGRFVENRIKEIKQIQSSMDGRLSFHYTCSSENPADLATRGTTFAEMKMQKLWWSGPTWLKSDGLPEWNLAPVTQELLEKLQAEHMKKKPQGIELGANPVLKAETVPIEIQHFSSLKKLLNTTVYCLRFLKMKMWKSASKEMKEKHPFLEKLLSSVQLKGPILLTELKVAKYFWDFKTQQQYFPEVLEALKKPEQKHISTINQLGLQLDSEKLIRCHGRLALSMLPDSVKFPKLMPKDAPYTKLVILDAHQKSTGEFIFHSGVEQTLAETRKEYWVVQGRQDVQKVLNSCSYYKKFKGKPYKQPAMPALPKERVSRAQPFEFTGLDYLGPVWYKLNDQKEKAWICLFTCLVTRAVHLEIVRDTTAKEFLNALRRFIARRGPKKILSDNAPHFKLVS